MNILIKLMSIVSLVIAPYIAISKSDAAHVTDVQKEIRVIKTTDSLGNQKLDTIENDVDTITHR
jgi:K(+)-stimulated pyrophosphate-energized sodium pump